MNSSWRHATVVYRAPSGADLAPSLFRVPLETDGVFDSCDCAPQDPGVAVLPSAARELMLEQSAASGPTTLSWQPPAFGVGGSLIYDLLRVDRADGFAATAVVEIECVAAGSALTSVVDADLPTSAFFYLVRPRHGCGAGPLGAGPEAAQEAVCPQ